MELRLLFGVCFSMNTAMSSSNNINKAQNRAWVSPVTLPIGAQTPELALQCVEFLAQGGLVDAGYDRWWPVA